MEHYLILKHLHITAAYASLAFFVLRAFWSVRGVALLQARWVKIVPHLMDTLLLTLGVTLAVILNFWPLPLWLSAKITALVIYILLGTVAIKRGKTPKIRATAAIAAVLVFAYIIGAAVERSALSWLG
ncbi:MAG TPA: regulator SirB [Halomonas sp.]|uniref:SirB2 family protein n=1 Tax=unclassified Halomonas TaxID=2609666 RepID=UPI0005CC5600|nr:MULTISPECIES: SirB2 family protein [Halomonas]KTG22982.1 regulator SirB [Idiomarina sp. H105]MCO7242383.1 SirB2 family protein [Halomonas sp. Ps84H-12]MEC9020161.1 SirB2 family protein [Pseudomonadota bacterium]OAE89864.1 regulator SirB [Idiomarina sp. WRN-38]KJD19105.1 Invasion gene expression up-regulator SirB [Halomonas meridiana]